MKIMAKPLTARDFSRFGIVTDIPGKAGAHTIEGAFDRDGEASVPVIQMVQIDRPVPDIFVIERLEHHPHSAQSFLPLNGVSSLIIVCNSHEDGTADAATAQAFVAGPQQSVTYRRGVWHHSLMPLASSASFAMVMAQAPRSQDTRFTELHAPLRVTLV